MLCGHVGIQHGIRQYITQQLTFSNTLVRNYVLPPSTEVFHVLFPRPIQARGGRRKGNKRQEKKKKMDIEEAVRPHDTVLCIPVSDLQSHVHNPHLASLNKRQQHFNKKCSDCGALGHYRNTCYERNVRHKIEKNPPLMNKLRNIASPGSRWKNSVDTLESIHDNLGSERSEDDDYEGDNEN